MAHGYLLRRGHVVSVNAYSEMAHVCNDTSINHSADRQTGKPFPSPAAVELILGRSFNRLFQTPFKFFEDVIEMIDSLDLLYQGIRIRNAKATVAK